MPVNPGDYQFRAGGTTTGATLGDTTFSGVYNLTRTDATRTVIIGGQRVSVLDAAKSWSAKSLQDQSQLTAQLIEAGYLKRSSADSHVARQQAYIALLNDAAFSPGQDVGQTLQQAIQFNRGTGLTRSGGTAGTASTVYPMTSVEDINATANATAQKLIGRRLNPDELSQIAASVNDLRSVSAAQRRAGRGMGAVEGYVGPPSAAAATQSFVENQRPVEFQTENLMNVLQTVRDRIVNSGLPNEPNLQPVKV